MKRTTIYFEPELDALLKLEMLRQKQSMAEIVREALHGTSRAWLGRRPPALVPSRAGEPTPQIAPSSCWPRQALALPAAPRGLPAGERSDERVLDSGMVRAQ